MAIEFPVAILAGGLATRLRPITEKIPKSLVRVAGHSFLAHQIELLRSQGLRRIVLCVGHLGEMIEREFGDGSEYGVKLQYSLDGPTLLGTGGAIRKALPMLGPEFFVLYGDSYLPIDYQAVAQSFKAFQKPALMTVYANSGQYDTSNVWFENGQIKTYNKKNLRPEMHHIDYGLSAFRAEVFGALPSGVRFDLADLLRDLAVQGDLAGFEVDTRFYEIGSPGGLAELDALLKSRSNSK
jgi:NDP-sugar pyrophosphorylase family protein